jgi:HSP20 family protein
MKTGKRPHSFSLFDELDRGLNLLVNEVFTGDRRPGSRSLPVTVTESDQAYQVLVDLPGVQLDDISLQLAEGTLELKAERKQAEPSEDIKVTVDERRYGTVTRAIQFDKDVNVEAVDAQLENGVLTVTVEKVKKLQPTQIPVRRA